MFSIFKWYSQCLPLSQVSLWENCKYSSLLLIEELVEWHIMFKNMCIWIGRRNFHLIRLSVSEVIPLESCHDYSRPDCLQFIQHYKHKPRVGDSVCPVRADWYKSPGWRRDAVGIQLSDNVPGRAYNVITLNKPSPGPSFNSHPLYLFQALHFESGPVSNWILLP